MLVQEADAPELPPEGDNWERHSAVELALAEFLDRAWSAQSARTLPLRITPQVRQGLDLLFGGDMLAVDAIVAELDGESVPATDLLWALRDILPDAVSPWALRLLRRLPLAPEPAAPPAPVVSGPYVVEPVVAPPETAAVVVQPEPAAAVPPPEEPQVTVISETPGMVAEAHASLPLPAAPADATMRGDDARADRLWKYLFALLVCAALGAIVAALTALVMDGWIDPIRAGMGGLTGAVVGLIGAILGRSGR